VPSPTSGRSCRIIDKTAAHAPSSGAALLHLCCLTLLATIAVTEYTLSIAECPSPSLPQGGATIFKTKYVYGQKTETGSSFVIILRVEVTNLRLRAK